MAVVREYQLSCWQTKNAATNEHLAASVTQRMATQAAIADHRHPEKLIVGSAGRIRQFAGQINECVEQVRYTPT